MDSSLSPVSPTSLKAAPALGPTPAESTGVTGATTRRRRGSSIPKTSLDAARPKPAPPAPPPRPPSPQRADSSIMPASESDEEPPEGGWYVKRGDPTSLLRERKAAAAAAAAASGKTRRRSSVAGTGLISNLSTRRQSRTAAAAAAVSNVHATAEPTGVTVIENPDIAALPARGLFRRRTAPTRRNNKDDEAAIRKRAERAVRDLGKMSAEAP